MTAVSPVFIVGAARSGTTALATALAEGAGYAGFGEGHFLPLLGQLITRVTLYFKSNSIPAGNSHTLLFHVSESEIKDALRRYFRFRCDCAYGSRPWFDKTPDSRMILTCPELLAVWPDALILYAKRRPIDNILSRLRKFQGLSFENACEEWSRCAQAWETVRRDLQARFLEIDQLEMLQSPGFTAARLAEVLCLDSCAQSRLMNVLRRRRPEQTSQTLWTPLSQTGWSDEQIEFFRKSCGDTMSTTGYGEEHYWDRGRVLNQP